jgi:histidinol-phosphate phosphatase family protein
LPVRSRQIRTFATLQVFIWLKATIGLFNPASHGVEQKQFPLRSCDVAVEISLIEAREESLNRAIFLDRDGVINEDREDYIKSWEEFRFIKGVRPALKKIHQAGVPVVVITNQSVIGRGLVTEDELSFIHDRMGQAVQKSGGRITKVYFCPHHPEDHCRCRKPRIGLLKKAARDLKLDLKKCVFVGDNLKDIQAGNRAGCRTLLVQTGQGKESLVKIISGKTRINPDWVCATLSAATPLILDYFRSMNDNANTLVDVSGEQWP